MGHMRARHNELDPLRELVREGSLFCEAGKMTRILRVIHGITQYTHYAHERT